MANGQSNTFPLNHPRGVPDARHRWRGVLRTLPRVSARPQEPLLQVSQAFAPQGVKAFLGPSVPARLAGWRNGTTWNGPRSPLKSRTHTGSHSFTHKEPDAQEAVLRCGQHNPEAVQARELQPTPGGPRLQGACPRSWLSASPTASPSHGCCLSWRCTQAAGTRP